MTTTSKTISEIGPVRVRYESRPVNVYRPTRDGEPNWKPVTARWLVIQLGKGAGYRWIDLPGHSMNAAHKIRRRLYVSGRTLYIGRWAKANYMYRTQWGRNRWSLLIPGKGGHAPFYVTGLSRRCNRDVYPGWY